MGDQNLSSFMSPFLRLELLGGYNFFFFLGGGGGGGWAPLAYMASRRLYKVILARKLPSLISVTSSNHTQTYTISIAGFLNTF